MHPGDSVRVISVNEEWRVHNVDGDTITVESYLDPPTLWERPQHDVELVPIASPRLRTGWFRPPNL